MGVKQIALIVAGIVVIGAVVVFLTGGWLTETISDVWDWMWSSIQSWFS